MGATDSDVGVVGTLTLISNGQQIGLPFDAFLQSAEVELSPGGAWIGTIKLWDAEGDTLEKIVIAAGKSRDVELEFGWDDPVNNFRRKFIGAVTNYVPEIRAEGTLLNVEVVSRSVLGQVIDKRIRSFPEGRTCSEIVQAIADERGWQSIIEPTVAKLQTPFSSKGESDLNFIREQIRPQAVNQSGVGGYLFYFDESDVMHFHTPSFQDNVLHTYNYTRDSAGDVMSFIPQDNQLFGALYGGGNSLYGSPTSLLGETATQQANQGTGIEGGIAGSPVVQDQAAQLNLGEGTHSYVNLVARDPEEVQRLTKARYDEYRRFSFKASLRLMGTHRIRLTHFVQVNYTKQDGTLHYLSGTFQVFKIKHFVGVGEGWTTELEMLREGIPNEEGTIPIAGVGTVSTEQGGDPDTVEIPVE